MRKSYNRCVICNYCALDPDADGLRIRYFTRDHTTGGPACDECQSSIAEALSEFVYDEETVRQTDRDDVENDYTFIPKKGVVNNRMGGKRKTPITLVELWEEILEQVDD